MANWQNRLTLTTLYTNNRDHASIQASMTAIADKLEAAPFFMGFSTERFRTIPAGDDVISPADYANKLIDKMYDFADDHRIWID